MRQKGIARSPSLAEKRSDRLSFCISTTRPITVRSEDANTDGGRTVNLRAISAELIGSFTYTVASLAAVIFTASSGDLLTAALGPGLAFIGMSYALGHVSGGHFNPAVTLGLVAGGRFARGHALAYIAAQLSGAIAATALIIVIRSGASGGTWPDVASLANTFGGPQQFSLLAVALVDWLAAAILVIVFMGATSRQAPSGVAPLAIGFSITMLHFITLAVSNAGFNPARATAVALFSDVRALSQLWVFWVAPVIGAVTGGLLARWLNEEE
jgi:aquaporin Z